MAYCSANIRFGPKADMRAKIADRAGRMIPSNMVRSLPI